MVQSFCRGLPKLSVSDNFKLSMQNFLPKGGIKWQFILEKLQWWGGFYEGLVGFVKNSWKKIIGKALCKYKHLTIYLCEIERAINR